VAGRIKSVEKSNDLIENRTRDIPACNIVPQPTMLPPALNMVMMVNLFIRLKFVNFPVPWSWVD
jgi:hypothetical protein